MENMWTLISPDGDSWDGGSPIESCGKAVRHRRKELTDAERLENLADALSTPVPYKKRRGSKISATGIFNQVSSICEGLPEDHYPRWEFALRDMLKHLQDMADKFYAKDGIHSVDNFLQLYDLDRERLDADT